MGFIKAWSLEKEDGVSRWRIVQRDELQHHRTKINEMIYGHGQLWSGNQKYYFNAHHLTKSMQQASSDETARAQHDPPLDTTDKVRPMPPITHPTAVRAILPLSTTLLAEPYLLTGAGDVIRAYDISSPDEPELLGEMDAHWHDVTALRLWMRKSTIEGEHGKFKLEPWVVSASLDGTLRKWKLLGTEPKLSIPFDLIIDSRYSQTYYVRRNPPKNLR